MRTIRFQLLWCFLLFTMAWATACDDDSEGPYSCSKAASTYILTPNGTSTSFTLTEHFSYSDTEPEFGETNCDRITYLECNGSDLDQFRYWTGSGCPGFTFTGTLHAQTKSYEFSGMTLRAYNSGSGAFSSGSYSTNDGDFGAFEFYENGRKP